MKHLVVCEYGTSLCVTGCRLVVKQQGDILAEYPLSRLHTITIAKTGVSISSTLITECAIRGTRIFVSDNRGNIVSDISGVRAHGVGQTRRMQVLFLENNRAASELSMRIVYGKIRNQRAVLLYFAKSSSSRQSGVSENLTRAAEALKRSAEQAFEISRSNADVRARLLGIEGEAAAIYWQAWVDSGLLPTSFVSREGRGSSEIVNSALNYGYAIVVSRVWNAVLVAGLEPYLGFYHTDRPGKPSLVLDMMEEYRAWCVDRVILKNRFLLAGQTELTPTVKKRVINDIQEVFSKSFISHGKRLSLDTILQRQIYRLCGHFAGNKIYRPFLFKW